MSSCVPHLKPYGRTRQICTRCQTIYEVPPEIPIRGAKCKQIDLNAPPPKLAKCGECTERQETANKLIPHAGDAIALLADPIAEAVGWKEKSLLLEFAHGLGDNVQFTIVLKHLRAIYPDWKIDVVTVPACHAMMRSAGARYAFEHGKVRGEHVYTRHIGIQEPDGYSCRSPWTKSETNLRNYFKTTARGELCRYHVGFDDEHRAAADAFLRTLPTSRGIVLLHYWGHSMRRAKNLHQDAVKRSCREILARGYTPVIFDYDHRSDLIDGETIFRAETPGDPSTTAALADRAVLCVGIDSGPGHVFGSETLSTPTLIVWRKNHPYHYYGLADHVTHLVPRDHWRYLRGADTWNHGLGFFQSHYHYTQYRQNLRNALPRLVAKMLDEGPAAVRAERELEIFGHFDHASLLDSLDTAPDVFLHVGVGPRPHCEAAQIKARWPHCRILGLEPHPEVFADRQHDYPGELLKLAATKTPHPVTLHTGANDRGLSSTLEAIDGANIDYAESVSVMGVPIDDIAPEAQNAFLWLDIEGGELAALQGAERFLRGTRWVYLEVSERPRRIGEPTPAEIDSFLCARGFVEDRRTAQGDVTNRLYRRVSSPI